MLGLPPFGQGEEARDTVGKGIIRLAVDGADY